MMRLARSTELDPTLDPEVLHESARRQFRLSWVVLLALACAALGQVRPLDEAAAPVKLGHSHVMTPTFMPPPATPARPPSYLRVRIG
ncbi:MAG: hypothetical protein ABSC22_17040 [Roseiarcus sp.]|jgi:hypothetical protein